MGVRRPLTKDLIRNTILTHVREPRLGDLHHTSVSHPRRGSISGNRHARIAALLRRTGHNVLRVLTVLVVSVGFAVPDFTGVAHIELTVRDADRSASWYEQVLGMQRLEIPEEFLNASVPAREVSLMHPTAGLVLSLIQHASGVDGDFSEFRVGLDHLALAVESRSELEDWVAHFDGHGVRHSAISDRQWGSVLVFRDPDNIQLELFSF